MTPVPAHSRHLAGSAATGEAATTEGEAAAASSSAAAEALEGADSAVMSEERPNAPAASAAARREVEGAAGDAAATALVVVVGGVPVASFFIGVGVRECKKREERWSRGRGMATAASRNVENSPSSSPVLEEAWAETTGLLLKAKRP